VSDAVPPKQWQADLADYFRLFADLGVSHFITGASRSQGTLYQDLQVAVQSALSEAGPDLDPAVRPSEPATLSRAHPGGTVPPLAAGSLPGFPPQAAPAVSRTALLDAADTPPPALDRAAKIEQLKRLRAEIGDCQRCRLHARRHHLVFGEGDPDAALMFIGEAPGEDEDLSGRPFVGRAGQLLDRMIAAMSLRREDVYIANVVKCRPPGNETPTEEESATCGPFVLRQVEIIQPRIVVSLGACATHYLLGGKDPMRVLRGSVHRWRGMLLIPTYHPSFLLRSPSYKKETWLDLQKAMALLNLPLPRR